MIDGRTSFGKYSTKLIKMPRLKLAQFGLKIKYSWLKQAFKKKDYNYEDFQKLFCKKCLKHPFEFQW